ncbi:THUMP domain-containing class I SAM-dependent RNA methyltransferase [Mucilaginibacter sp.]
MDIFQHKSRIIITCNKRLSPYLQQEVEALGFVPERVFSTGIELNGTVNDCITLNLNLRCASQVLYSLKSFTAADPDELYKELVTIEWENLIDFSGYFSITSNVNNEHIRTPLFANVKVKDAIADRIKSIKGIRPNSGPEQNKTVIHLYWQDDKADVFADTSGETLAKHSYRKLPGKAPMLEALAAATIMATGWDRNSTFVNPMCGSGTLAIEAALLATDKSPGFFRMNYGFMHLLGYDEQVFFAERRKLKDKGKKETGFKIIATDLAPEAIDIAQRNARTAGVEHLIDFAVADFADTEVPETPGVIMFNPEYGERLGTHSKLEATYARIGDFLKQKCGGYRGYVFTGNPDLAKRIGLKAARRIEFYNGKLDCRLLEYDLYQGSKREPKED